MREGRPTGEIISRSESNLALDSYWFPKTQQFWFRPGTRAAGFVLTTIPLVAWLLSNFFQLRGYVNLFASRLDLYIAAVIAIVGILGFSSALPRWRKRIALLGSVVLIAASVGLDFATAPRVRRTEVPISLPSGSVPQPVNERPKSGSPTPKSPTIPYRQKPILPSIPPEPPKEQSRLLGLWRAKYKPKELTLEDLMYIDFLDSMHIAIENMHAPGAESVSVKIALDVNLERSDEIAVIYIPSSEDTPLIMRYFANNLLGPIAFINQIKPWYKGPGDSNPMSGETVKFSGRVFIYHETPITQEDLFRIDALYKQQDMSVISRTSDYASVQRDKHELERLSLQGK